MIKVKPELQTITSSVENDNLNLIALKRSTLIWGQELFSIIFDPCISIIFLIVYTNLIKK